MSVRNLHNNLALSVLAISFVVREAKSLPVVNALTIIPIIAHRDMLKHLANARVRMQGIERYVIERPNYFSSFNDRFYDNLDTSVNAIQLGSEIGLTKVDGVSVESRVFVEYEASMGDRLGLVQRAAKNIATLLQSKSEALYLNARIEL